MKSYFDENLKLTDDENLENCSQRARSARSRRQPHPLCAGCKVTDSILADGCVIEHSGLVCCSAASRSKKGAVVQNCVLMQDTVVEANAELDCVVTDKNVKMHADEAVRHRELTVYVQKKHTV